MIRARQIIWDDDVDLTGASLLNLTIMSLAAQPDGTLPLAGELVFADGFIKAKNLLVTDKLQAGNSNTSFFLNKAITLDIDTRNRAYTYDSSDMLVDVKEKDGSTVVKTVTPTVYDSLGRITELVEATTEGTVTTTFTYDGDSENILTEAKAVS
jgi:hypothetical protein